MIIENVYKRIAHKYKNKKNMNAGEGVPYLCLRKKGGERGKTERGKGEGRRGGMKGGEGRVVLS